MFNFDELGEVPLLALEICIPGLTLSVGHLEFACPADILGCLADRRQLWQLWRGLPLTLMCYLPPSPTP
jgi:hypothetical protein